MAKKPVRGGAARGKNRNNNNNRRGRGNQNRGPLTTPFTRKGPDIHEITYSDGITLGELAKKCGRNASDLIKVLFMQGKMVTINTALDDDMVELVCLEYEIEPTKVKAREEDSLEDEDIPSAAVVGFDSDDSEEEE